MDNTRESHTTNVASSTVRTKFLQPCPDIAQRHPLPKRIETIFVVCVDRIGDALNALYFLANLRRHFPRAHIAFLGRPFIMDELFGALMNPYVDCFMPLESAIGLSCDLLFDLNPYRNPSVSKIASGCSVGFFSDIHDFSYKPPRAVMKSDEYLCLLHILGLNTQYNYLLPKFNTQPTPDSSPLSKPYVVLCPEATAVSRTLPPILYRDLLEALPGQASVDGTVVLGNRINNLDCLAGIHVNPEKAWDYRGKTTLLQAAHILSGAELVVTVDTGLMHLASYLGVPLIALFTVAHPERSGPQGQRGRALVLQARRKENCNGYPRKPDCGSCRKQITTTDALAALDILAKTDSTEVSERFITPQK